MTFIVVLQRQLHCGFAQRRSCSRSRPLHFSVVALDRNTLWVSNKRQASGAAECKGRNEAMELGIKGRRAIVTGGGSGIGYETARLFLEEGVRVLIAGRNADKLDKARDALAKQTGGEIHAVQADMTKQADIQRMVDVAKDKLGGVDILVNNAGTMYSGRFAVLDDNEMKDQLETKLFGFMRAIRLVFPMMKAQKWGRIVNTIGGAGKEPDPYMFGSGMTNAALLNLTKSLSTEFGEDNVLVNAICPGWVATDLWKRNSEGLKQELGVESEEEARRLAARKNSLGRFGKPEELANATVFLCSERASYITGVSLNLDGGRLKSLW
jgi:3-oxoacyl-[acyl-carrier protein] reductase